MLVATLHFQKTIFLVGGPRWGTLGERGGRVSGVTLLYWG